jgi:hypothetical protein
MVNLQLSISYKDKTGLIVLEDDGKDTKIGADHDTISDFSKDIWVFFLWYMKKDDVILQ